MKKHILLFSLGFVLLVAFGLFYNQIILQEQARAKDIIHMVTSLGVTRLEQDEVDLLSENDVNILEKLNGYDGDELKAIIYIGEGTGYKAGLKVAFAINTTTHHIIGMRIVESAETPAYISALLSNETFTAQFLEKDMSEKFFDIEVVSGVTPNGQTDVIGKFTSEGIQKIMELVRKQYDQDTEFAVPVGLELVSKVQNMDDIAQFIYTFDAIGEEVIVVVNQTYALISISNNEYEVDALDIINRNPMINFIQTAVVDGTTITLTIRTKGYSSTTLVSTATITDGTITAFSTNLANQSYDDDHNDLYAGGDVTSSFASVINQTAIQPISGATRTIEGIILARDLLYAYVEALDE